MSKLSLDKKIELINKYCKETLSIAHYCEWELNSYGKGTLFYEDIVKGKTIKDVVNKAYNIFKEVIRGEI
jgi:hypothetical protein